MKRAGINAWTVISSACLALFLSGCVSTSNSPTSRFYMLQAERGSEAIKETNIASNVLIGIGPVKIPEYLDRPQMVTHSKEKMLKFAEFDRWGESLDLGIGRMIRENLTVMLPAAKFTLYPWNPSISVKYQVMVEVVQLDSDINKDLFFATQWTIIDAQNMKTLIIKKSEFRQPIAPQNYFGLAKTLSTACASLSSKIAETLAAFESKNLGKEGVSTAS